MSSLKDLKRGDSVLISCDVCIGWVSYENYREEKVERVTPSGLIVVCGSKFNSDTGVERISTGRIRHIKTIDNEEALKWMNRLSMKIKVDRALDGIAVSCITHYANEQVGPEIEWDDDIDINYHNSTTEQCDKYFEGE